MTLRRGVGLPELLVALALSGVVMAVAARGLSHQLRLQRAHDAQARADDIVREVHEVLRAELGHAAGVVRLLGDTALDLASQRIVATPCDRNALRLVVPASEPWWSPPRAGDSLAVMDTLLRREWRGALASVGVQRPSAACPVGGTRLTLAEAPPATVPVLAVPARVWRMTRFAAYRSSDRLWWLGERSCTSSCGAAQPITGPLLPPGQGGLQFSLVHDAAGQPVALDVVARAVVAGRRSRRWARLPLAVAP